MLKTLERNYQNYIFDMDGTLVDSSVEVLKCLQQACYINNAQINKENFSSDLIGPPLKDIIKEAIIDNKNEDLISKIAKEFRGIYDNDENDASKMYENTYEWLALLKISGKKLFLATNKPSIPTLRLVNKLKLNMFEDIYTIDKYQEKQITKTEMILEIIKKYNLNKFETIMVGDAPSDIEAAHLAKIEATGVLWGYGRHKKKLEEMSDFILEIEDLKKLNKV